MQTSMNASDFKRQKSFDGIPVKVSEKKKLQTAFFDTWLFWMRDKPGLMRPTSEWKFHPDRQWRFDFAFVELKVAVEIQGGLYINGGHNRGVYQEECFLKYNEANWLGWYVLQFGPKMLHKSKIADAMAAVEKVLITRMPTL